jgi:FixJ family two-component response regulator
MPPRSAVLLVDDDLALLEALSGTLQFHLGHFTLDTCDTGIKGLAALSATHYDTIITDMRMPGMSGLEFLARVKETQPQTPVVLISGHGDRALVSKALDAGASDFIGKPIEREVFMRTVRQTLNLSRLRSLLERQQAMIGRARDHHICLVEKLGQSNERWLGLLAQAIAKDNSVDRPGDGLLRRETAKQQVDIFSRQADRHLAILDAFLAKTTHAHRQTLEELNVAQETLRQFALTRLHDRY